MSESDFHDQVREYADRLGVSVGDDALEEYSEQFEAQDELLTTLDEFVTTDSPVDRDHWKPDPEDDPNGAFLTRCDVTDGGGPLDGLSVGVKDNIAVAGVPMTCGSPVLADFVPSYDATVVERLLDDGARIVGKTNMDEFALGGDESTMRFRLARNPNATDHQPGSSSAGSGVAVAEGTVDVALGSDTGGSIRFPAAWCGIVGVKPTRGLVSHHGFVQFAKTLDNVGVLANTVGDAAVTLQSIAVEDPRDERTTGVQVDEYAGAVDAVADTEATDLTIGIPEELWGNAPDLDAVVDDALAELDTAGAELRDVSISGMEYALPSWLAIGMTEFGAYLDAGLNNHWLLSNQDVELATTFHDAVEDHPEELGDAVIETWLYAMHLNETYGDRYYALGHRGRRRVTEGVDAALADVDVLACTTVPMLPPEWGDQLDDLLGALSNTAPFNLTGHPAVSIPAGTIDGLPVGLQFVGEHFAEKTVLKAAAQWEQIRD